MRRLAAQWAIRVALAGLVTAFSVLLRASTGPEPESPILAWALVATFPAAVLLTLPLQQSLQAGFSRREFSELIWSRTPSWLRLAGGTTFIAGLVLGVILDEGAAPTDTHPRLVLVSALCLCWCSLALGLVYPMLLLDAGSDQ